MNKKALILLVISIILFGSLVISLATPWYYTKDIENSENYSITYYKYNEVKTDEYVNGEKSGSDSYTYDSSDKEAIKSQISIFSASLAFTVLALFVVTIFIVCLGLQLVGKNPIGVIAKFIPIISFIFCLLAMFIFCGIANARKNDCERYLDDLFCKTKYNENFSGSDNGNTFKWGPSVAFIFSIISSALNLAIVLVVFVLGIDSPSQ